MPRTFPKDRRKLAELILYISQQYASDPNYGSTHLYKTLFFADFLAYAKFGVPITGDDYRREKKGPVGRTVRSVREELARAGDLREKETPVSAGPMGMVTLKTPVPQREPDLSLFSESELELVDQIIRTFHGTWRAGAISKYTHELPQWHSAAMFDTIPYESVFIAEDQSFSEAEKEHALELAHQYGWSLSKRGR